MKNNYVPPTFEKASFTCPHCGVLSIHVWNDIAERYYDEKLFGQIYTSECQNSECNKYCLWINKKMERPDKEGIQLPNEDLNKDIQDDYTEASTIVNKSPRGASALLRLSIQKLCVQLGEPGKDINIDIGSLVRKGLRPSIQKSLDIVRVTGNESVHPGVIDMKDNKEVALKLFELVNLIAEVMISEPKRIDELYEKVIPEDKKQGIESRDKKEKVGI